MRVTKHVATPTNLRYSSVTSNSVVVNWNDNSTDESGFKGYLNGHYIGTVPSNRTNATLRGLTPNTSYSFYIRAVKGSTESENSNVIHFRTLNSTPSFTNSNPSNNSSTISFN